MDARDSGWVENVMRAIREERVESRFGRKIGEFIAGCELEDDESHMSGVTNRYRYHLAIDGDVAAESKLYKRIAFDLVFRSQQMAQLDHKADVVLGRMFDSFRGRYIESPARMKFRLLPAVVEAEIAAAGDEAGRARLVCDAVAEMTDPFAVRTYKRLFDADFGSIVDLV